MKDEMWKAALAGLLHDIGKFAGRAGESGKHAAIGLAVLEKEPFRSLLPYDWFDDIADATAYHHGGDTHKVLARSVRVADWLAAGERIVGEWDKGDPKTTPLVPIASRVELDKDSGDVNWGFPLVALDIRTPNVPKSHHGAGHPSLFPQQTPEVDQRQYKTLWEEFEGAIRAFPKPAGTPSRISGLMTVLRTYTSHIPSATPWEEDQSRRTVPDVSLYDHLKVTAAIAACLVRVPPDDLDALHTKGKSIAEDARPVARLLRGDLSGIQAFIYRITTPESERVHRNTAKRLRGRSFYVSLLAEAVADWFLRELGLTAANALFIGGGRFDLLVPIDARTESRLCELEASLQGWLQSKFCGVLGLQIAMEPLTPSDFADLGPCNAALDVSLGREKQKKNLSVLTEEFFAPAELEKVCNVCSLTPLSVSSSVHPCPLCECHKQVGAQLPKTGYIARVYGPNRSRVLDKLDQGTIDVDFEEPIEISVVLLDGDEKAVRSFVEMAAESGVETLVYRLNETTMPEMGWPDNATPAQTYLANAAPLVGDTVYEFDKIAEQSDGARLLGVLKADVDNLGLIFGLGLDLPTISRVAALSHAFERFFSGYLNTLCCEVTEKWKAERPEASKDYPPGLESLFYVVYSGGDDLLIIGPWDPTVELAKRLNDDFRAYACHNPNITLSAGIVMVKPHFPVQRFVHLADDALEASKSAGRDRITVFESKPVRWTDHGSHPGFDSLLKLAHTLREKVEARQMPATLVYDIDRLWRKAHTDVNGQTKPVITPELLYLLTRRLPRETRDELKRPILDAMESIHIPVSYVSLSTRKE